ncbi:MAG: hypothetical protein F9K32_05420 [Desulfobulbaceae bacterium]|nr:MAG: hypothetical protein F9K32_05420 [Desulfobulbaceae bacterium]
MYVLSLMHAGETFDAVLNLLRSGLLDQFSSDEWSASSFGDTSQKEGMEKALSLGLITRNGERIRLTSAGTLLTKNHPQSLRDHFLFVGEVFRPCYALDQECLAAGGNNFQRCYGSTFFEWLSRHPVEKKFFHSAMCATQGPVEEFLANDFPFADYSWIVDVGGGSGGLASAIKKKYCEIRITVADTDPGIPRSTDDQKRNIEFQVADFFDRVPTGADLYMAKLVIHDWPDDEAERILGTIRDSMSESSTLLLIESPLPPLGRPDAACLWDYHQMVAFGGKERSIDAFQALARRAGLWLSATRPTIPPFHFLEMRRL